MTRKVALGSADDLPRLLYKRREVAEMFGVSERRIKNWTLSGFIKAIRPAGENGPAFYSVDEVRRVMKARQK